MTVGPTLLLLVGSVAGCSSEALPAETDAGAGDELAHDGSVAEHDAASDDRDAATPRVDAGGVDASTGPVVERHPGHWVLLSDLESIRVPPDAPASERADLEALDEIAGSSDGIAGVMVRFFWRDLNPGEDAFRFDRVREHLDRLAAIAADGGPHMVYALLIAWRSYHPDDHPMPPHLAHLEEPSISGGTVDGYRGQVWKPELRARYRELLEAMAAAVGDDPHFAGVGTQETAVGPGPRDGYSGPLYRDALVDIGTMHREVFPREEIFFMFNFLSTSPSACEELDRATECGSWPTDRAGCGPCLLGQVLAALAGLDIALGGPDILPNSDPLNQLVYPHYPALEDAGASLFCHAQKDSFRVDDGSGGFVPMQDIFEFARDELAVDYVFWFHKETGPGQDYSAAVPVIDSHPPPWR